MTLAAEAHRQTSYKNHNILQSAASIAFALDLPAGQASILDLRSLSFSDPLVDTDTLRIVPLDPLEAFI